MWCSLPPRWPKNSSKRLCYPREMRLFFPMKSLLYLSFFLASQRTTLLSKLIDPPSPGDSTKKLRHPLGTTLLLILQYLRYSGPPYCDLHAMTSVRPLLVLVVRRCLFVCCLIIQPLHEVKPHLPTCYNTHGFPAGTPRQTWHRELEDSL